MPRAIQLELDVMRYMGRNMFLTRFVIFWESSDFGVAVNQSKFDKYVNLTRFGFLMKPADLVRFMVSKYEYL